MRVQEGDGIGRKMNPSGIPTVHRAQAGSKHSKTHLCRMRVQEGDDIRMRDKACQAALTTRAVAVDSTLMDRACRQARRLHAARLSKEKALSNEGEQVGSCAALQGPVYGVRAVTGCLPVLEEIAHAACAKVGTQAIDFFNREVEDAALEGVCVQGCRSIDCCMSIN